MREPLSGPEIQAAVASLPEWRVVEDADGQSLVRVLRFGDFAAAFRFMTAAAEAFEAAQHHPRWTNSYGTLEIALTTHDAGNRLTSRDVTMAQELDALVRNLAP